MKRLESRKDLNGYTLMKDVLINLELTDKDYIWLISDIEAYPSNKSIEKEINENGYLLLSTKELISMLEEEDFQWIWAVFSAIPTKYSKEEILKFNLPFIEPINPKYDPFNDFPKIQHPLAVFEICASDSSGMFIVSDNEDLLNKFKMHYPLYIDTTNKKEVLFYRKLNEYYQERDYLFTLKSYRGHSYSIVDFLLFTVITCVLLLLGIILSIIYQDITYSPIFLLISIPGFIVSFIIFKGRKKQINKIEKLEKELRDIIEENKPLFNDKILTLGDYIRDFESLGFNIKIIDENNKKTYLVMGTKRNLKIITKNTFFINTLKCYIGDIDFKKIKNDNVELNQLINDYRLDSFNINYYQMLFSFYKYVIETIDDYL